MRQKYFTGITIAVRSVFSFQSGYRPWDWEIPAGITIAVRSVFSFQSGYRSWPRQRKIWESQSQRKLVVACTEHLLQIYCVVGTVCLNKLKRKKLCFCTWEFYWAELLTAKRTTKHWRLNFQLFNLLDKKPSSTGDARRNLNSFVSADSYHNNIQLMNRGV